MKSYYDIDVSQRLIHKHHKGQITVDEEIELLNSIIADPKFRKGMNALCDFREAKVDWELGELDRFRSYVTRIKHNVGQSKWAIVIGPAGNDTTARIFIALHQAFEDTINVKLFGSIDEAQTWLEEDALAEETK